MNSSILDGDRRSISFGQHRLSIADYIFYAGISFVPFDNLKFAPSAGWAAISPYFFLLAAILFFLNQQNSHLRVGVSIPKKILLFILLGASCSLLSFAIYPVYWNAVALTAIKLLLGFSFLYCVVNVHSRGDYWIVRSARLLFWGYLVSLAVGVFQFFLILGMLPPLIPFEAIFSRYYSEKIQFTFTEPSFASIHVFGVLLFFWAFLPLAYRKERRRLVILGCMILGLSIFSGSSLRALADCCLVGLAFGLVSPLKRKIKIATVAVIGAIALFLFLPANLTDRVNRVFDATQSLDPSATIRKFRVNSAIYGAFENTYTAIMGYGFGNSAEAMRIGYDEALSDVVIDLIEIDELKDAPDGLTYSLHAKVLAEHGMLGYLALIFVLYSRRHKFLWLVTLIVYLQFDSYAFYGLWLFLYARIFDLATDSVLLKRFSNNRTPIINHG